MAIAGLDPTTFLKEYWQKKPLLIRQGLPAFKDPITPEELAGLACEEGVESRLVFTENSSASNSWSMKPSPFKESDFTSLPDSHYTLMVQSVEQWLPELKALCQQIDFLPNWRRDDLMISFATPESGTGPHFDFYDVFIIQGKGSRLWKIGQQCNPDTAVNTESGLKILEEFEEQESFELQSGDILYIPPGLAHWGVSIDESLSYSIGFRAPSQAEVLIGISDELAAQSNDFQRYRDSLESPTKQPGLIPSNIGEELQAMILKGLQDTQQINLWFGRYMTEPRIADEVIPPESPVTTKQMQELLEDENEFWLNSFSRIAYQIEKQKLHVFFDGESHTYPYSKELEQLAEMLSAESGVGVLNLDMDKFFPKKTNPDCMSFLSELYNRGTIFLEI